MRSNYEQLQPASWTFEEGLHHVTATFDRAVSCWPDVMEPYVILLAEAADDIERKQIMQSGLRETVAARYDRQAKLVTAIVYCWPQEPFAAWFFVSHASPLSRIARIAGMLVGRSPAAGRSWAKPVDEQTSSKRAA